MRPRMNRVFSRTQKAGTRVRVSGTRGRLLSCPNSIPREINVIAFVHRPTYSSSSKTTKSRQKYLMGYTNTKARPHGRASASVYSQESARRNHHCPSFAMSAFIADSSAVSALARLFAGEDATLPDNTENLRITIPEPPSAPE